MSRYRTGRVDVSAGEDKLAMSDMLHSMLKDDKRDGLSTATHMRRFDVIPGQAAELAAVLRSKPKKKKAKKAPENR